MVRRRQQIRPAEWLAAGGPWPQGRLVSGAPPEAHVAKSIAVALQIALEGQSRRAVAADADLAHTTVYDLLAGKTYGDVITVARLEDALNRRLWPSRP